MTTTQNATLIGDETAMIINDDNSVTLRRHIDTVDGEHVLGEYVAVFTADEALAIKTILNTIEDDYYDDMAFGIEAHRNDALDRS